MHPLDLVGEERCHTSSTAPSSLIRTGISGPRGDRQQDGAILNRLVTRRLLFAVA